MKVLLVAGVGERPEACLFPELVARGITVKLLCDTTSSYFVPLKDKGFPMTHLVMRSRFDLAAIRLIRRALREDAYDIMHAFNSRALSNSLLAATGLKVKRVGYCGAMGHLSRWDPSARMSILSPRADRIVCVSKAVMNYLRGLGVPDCRLVQIYKGYDPAWLSAAPRSALREFGIPDDAVVVACTANARPIKGIPVLMQAIRHLGADLPVHVLLIGENDDARITKLLDDSLLRERVHLAGFRMDAPALVGACDLFVMPTIRYEGLSKAVTEAMCLSLPSVITAAGGMVELVEDGKTGIIVPPGDYVPLAAAIRKYVCDPAMRRQHGAAARERLENIFSFSQTVDRTIEMYRSLLQEQKPR